MAFLPPVVVPVKVAPQTALRDIKITSPNGHGPGTNVEVDGVKAINAHAVKFEITAESWASVEIRFLPNAFEFDGQAAVSVDAKTAELLVSLGWTPPA